MDLNAIAEYLPLFGEAALLTVKLGVLGIIFSIIIGLICAVVQYYKVPVIRRIVSVYIEISRNTPLLVQLFFIYYGLPKVGIPTDAETCGRQDTDRKRLFSRNEQNAGNALCDTSAGDVGKYPGVCRKRDISYEGNERVQCDKPA